MMDTNTTIQSVSALSENVINTQQIEIDHDLSAKHNSEIWNSVNSIAPLHDLFIKSLQQIEQYNQNLINTDVDNSNDATNTLNINVIKNQQPLSGSGSVDIGAFLKKHQQLEVDCVENEIVEENELVLKRYCLHMQTYYDRYLKLCEQISNTVDELTQLLNKYVKVSDKTTVLDVTSRQLVSIQTQLKQMNGMLSNELGYYLTARTVSQRITNQTITITSTSNTSTSTQQQLAVISQILDQIDDGIEYMLSHPSHKQSELYQTQYKSSLSVIISLIKTYITNVFEQATSEAINNSTTTTSAAIVVDTNTTNDNSKQDQDQPDQDQEVINANLNVNNSELDPAISYYYGKFQAVSYKIQPIIQQIEARCHKNKEYEHLLNEIQQIYMDKRYELMNDSITNSIRALAKKNQTDRSLLFRTSCSLFMLLCQDEHQLYYVFFTTKTHKLQEYLLSICEHLYDTLRPCIVHIEHIEILCELCSILKYDVLQSSFNQYEYTSSSASSRDQYNSSSNEALQAFNSVVSELLRDIQERLVFRSHIYFRIDILQYQPSAGDLAYPDKLQMMMNIVTQQNEQQQQQQPSTNKRDNTPGAPLRRTDSTQSVTSVVSSQHKPMTITDLQGMWYPTIRRTLQCLSRLYRCVDVQTFQGLSQEAISFCVISIHNAGALITQRKTPLDADLFQIKHLLILREQIAAFQVDFTARETTLDFTKVKEAASDLIHRKNLFKMDSNNAILKFLLEGTPQVKEHLLDSKKDADLQLKKTCQHLISHVTNLLIDPLQQLNQKIQDYRKLCGHEFNIQKFRAEKWTEPENLASIVNNVKRNMKTRITPIQNSMTLYIHNRETESILFRPIKNNIIGAFVQLEQLLSECYYEWNELLTISCPTADQISLMLSSVTLLNSQQQQQQQQQQYQQQQQQVVVGVTSSTVDDVEDNN